MTGHEFLLSYGNMGEFGRFRSAAPLSCERGTMVVLRSHRGLELGVVLCAATPGHAQFLPNTTVGQMVRLAGPEDVRQAEAMSQRGRSIFEEGRRLVAELGLSLELLDVEVTLDGEQAILHHLPWGEFDERDLVSALARSYDLRIRLHSLKTEAEPESEEEHGCGREDCGRVSGDGCGSNGGCATCGSSQPRDLKAYFADLRQQMHQRTPLL
jgi:cell fate regulator YaaT (PSP1 superfamily)